jgi:hypothetical protein
MSFFTGYGFTFPFGLNELVDLSKLNSDLKEFPLLLMNASQQPMT